MAIWAGSLAVRCRRGSPPLHGARSGIGGPGTDPSLPEPGLDWLRRAHGAKGVWISERARPGEATVWHRAISEKTLSAAHVAVTEQRLAQAVEQGTSGAERLEAGTLLFGSAGGVIAGVLLPAGAPQPSLDLAGGLRCTCWREQPAARSSRASKPRASAPLSHSAASRSGWPISWNGFSMPK